ncbi:MAG: hypothetical protein COW88_00610 [Candidatus Lloydbacteria bacterium CG22_combo_CG10-13_8_21_14_all_47_15]|uniref:Uncharacterized protein n=1 Tax=Candidatus Lloydbacteria bacterium CG22_combo_CG10-13_8_21_14_all_47_15 TaxID=1974635 RepID=A0A2H0CV99_9BACT|nr:MAG: hypothetical protein COW88_00610 [Candidatus Lloydbacteria bacterium CG22_combo_CG10-13_8_21_14_all_47_15]
MPLWRTFVADRIVLAFILFWILFIYLLRPDGPIGWQDEKLFDGGWWIDTSAHLISGIVGGCNIIYIIRRYVLHGIFRISGFPFLVIITIGAMGGFAFLWEYGELIHDMTLVDPCRNPLLIAQKAKLDTWIDWSLTGIIGPLLASIGYKIRDMWYERYYPEGHLKEFHAELKSDIRHIGIKIDMLRKRHGHHHVRPILRMFQKTLRHFKKHPPT